MGKGADIMSDKCKRIIIELLLPFLMQIIPVLLDKTSKHIDD